MTTPVSARPGESIPAQRQPLVSERATTDAWLRELERANAQAPSARQVTAPGTRPAVPAQAPLARSALATTGASPAMSPTTPAAIAAKPEQESLTGTARNPAATDPGPEQVNTQDFGGPQLASPSARLSARRSSAGPAPRNAAFAIPDTVGTPPESSKVVVHDSGDGLSIAIRDGALNPDAGEELLALLDREVGAKQRRIAALHVNGHPLRESVSDGTQDKKENSAWQ